MEEYALFDRSQQSTEEQKLARMSIPATKYQYENIHFVKAIEEPQLQVSDGNTSYRVAHELATVDEEESKEALSR